MAVKYLKVNSSKNRHSDMREVKQIATINQQETLT
jgi:hypothetical protein